MKKKNYKQVKKKFENVVAITPKAVVVADEPIELTTINGSKDKMMRICVTILIASLIGMILCSFMEGINLIILIKNSLLVGILDFILIFYVQIYKDRILFPSYTWWLLGISYLVSILLLCNPYEISLYPFWLIGIVFIAAYISANLSLIFCYGLIVASMVTGTFDMNTIVIHILLGTFICLMARYLTKLNQLCYALVLVISMNITLLFIINSFKLEDVVNKSLVFMILADASVLGIVYIAKLIRPGVSYAAKIQSELNIDGNQVEDQVKDQEKEQAIDYVTNQEKDQAIDYVTNQEKDKAMEPIGESKEDQEEAKQQAIKSEEVKQQETKLEEELAITKEKESREIALLAAIASDAHLLVQMKSESEKLFHHSMVVADLSRRAAQYVGADDLLACAGGWYHEIGRLTGKDYILHGVALMKEHQLPIEIADIIVQHNFKQQLPQTLEAVIVMLTDNIVSTIQYVKNHMENHITPDKVIENTFLVRMNKGILNEAKMTVAEFTMLKEFYFSIMEEFR